MKISDQELAHLEKLARLALDPGEREALRDDLSTILDYFETLNELDTDRVEEMVRPVPLANVLRDDQVRESLRQEVALGLAIETEDGFFKVPRTVEGDA